MTRLLLPGDLVDSEAKSPCLSLGWTGRIILGLQLGESVVVCVSVEAKKHERRNFVGVNILTLQTDRETRVTK